MKDMKRHAALIAAKMRAGSAHHRLISAIGVSNSTRVRAVSARDVINVLKSYLLRGRLSAAATLDNSCLA